MPRKKTVTEVTQESQVEKDPKAVQTAKDRATKTQQAAKALTVEGVVKDIASLGVKVNQVLGTISQGLTTKLDELRTAQDAIALAEQELQTISDKETVVLATNELVFQHQRRMAELEAELASKEQEAKEFDTELAKRRQRESADYEYSKLQERKRAEDAFQDRMTRQRKEADDALEQLQKDWKQREEGIKAKEAALAAREDEVAGFPARLEQEVSKAVATATKSVHAEYGVKAALAAKDAEADKRQAAQEVAGLRQTIATLEGTVQALREELSVKSSQVQEIAVAAVQSASGRQALEAVQTSVAAQSSGGAKRTTKE